MSTITKEQAKDLRNAFECWQQDYDPVEDKEQYDMFGLGIVAMDSLLASLEAEPVAYIRDGFRADGVHFCGGIITAEEHERTKPALSDRYTWKHQPLYTAPPAPVSVPDDVLKGLLPDAEKAEFWFEHNGKILFEGVKFNNAVFDACRAAMLQGADGKSPVIPDDVRRMDWLVSKTVDVREPMVYGSHSLFWSQAITDEEDEYHATKLREQIDAAMEAEQAAAPQQEAQ